MSEFISINRSTDVSQGNLNDKNPGNPDKVLSQSLPVDSLHQKLFSCWWRANLTIKFLKEIAGSRL
jgi:hypothetical protein